MDIFQKSNFQPKFKEVDSIDKVTDLINRPHEDYPKYVSNTKNIILRLIQNENHILYTSDVKAIHGFIFTDMLPEYRGSFRTTSVKVGKDTPPNGILIPDYMREILPISYNNSDEETITELKDWYRKFQIIHPFIDGNGRTGGVVIAVLSYLKTDKFLAPCQ